MNNEKKMIQGSRKLLNFIEKNKSDPRFKNINLLVIKLCLDYDEIPSIRKCAYDLGVSCRTINLWINKLEEIGLINKGIYFVDEERIL